MSQIGLGADTEIGLATLTCLVSFERMTIDDNLPVNSDRQIPAWVNGALRPYDKLAVHREGLRHMAVSIFVLAGNDVLIQRRAQHKYHTPGLWANTCCTHPFWQEDVNACATRRLQEELGITGISPRKRGQVEYRADVGGGMIEHEVVDVFVAQTTLDLFLRLDPQEVMETTWIDSGQLIADVKEMPSKFTPWLQIYLARHSDLIFE